MEIFITTHNNDIAEIVEKSKGLSFITFRDLLDNYYYMLSDHGESTQDYMLRDGLYVGDEFEEQNPEYMKGPNTEYLQPLYREYRTTIDDWSRRQYELNKKIQGLKGGKTRKNRKPRK